MSPPSLRLHYFGVHGRAEPARIMLEYGGIPYENVVFDFKQWPSIKPSMPFGQCPVLEVDGKMLAQSSAIDRYVATLVGLCPTDLWLAAKADEVMAFYQEMCSVFTSTYAIKDEEAKIKARQEICAGVLKEKMLHLASLLAANGGEYFVGTGMTYADIAVYCNLSFMISGFLDGVPNTLLDDYPTLKAHHNRIAAQPKIAARYANAEGINVSFKALP